MSSFETSQQESIKEVTVDPTSDRSMIEELSTYLPAVFGYLKERATSHKAESDAQISAFLGKTSGHLVALQKHRESCAWRCRDYDQALRLLRTNFTRCNGKLSESGIWQIPQATELDWTTRLGLQSLDYPNMDTASDFVDLKQRLCAITRCLKSKQEDSAKLQKTLDEPIAFGPPDDSWARLSRSKFEAFSVSKVSTCDNMVVAKDAVEERRVSSFVADLVISEPSKTSSSSQLKPKRSASPSECTASSSKRAKSSPKRTAPEEREEQRSHRSAGTTAKQWRTLPDRPDNSLNDPAEAGI